MQKHYACDICNNKYSWRIIIVWNNSSNARKEPIKISDCFLVSQPRVLTFFLLSIIMTKLEMLKQQPRITLARTVHPWTVILAEKQTRGPTGPAIKSGLSSFNNVVSLTVSETNIRFAIAQLLNVVWGVKLSVRGDVTWRNQWYSRVYIFSRVSSRMLRGIDVKNNNWIIIE